jgi:hypothetical protein
MAELAVPSSCGAGHFVGELRNEGAEQSGFLILLVTTVSQSSEGRADNVGDVPVQV